MANKLHKPLKALFSTNASFFSSSPDPQNNNIIINTLISIFTKQPYNPENPQLLKLAPQVTVKIVESVLNGFNSWQKAHFFFSWASNLSGYKHNVYTYNAMATILSHARQNAALKTLAVDLVNSRTVMSSGSLGFFIRCLGHVGLAKEANFMLDQVKIMGLCVPDSYSYCCLLETLAKSSCVDLVELRLKEMRDESLSIDKYALTPVLQAYCNAGMFDKAVSTFDLIYGSGWVDQHVVCLLVVGYSKWGKVDEAFELIERMEERHVRLNEKTFYVLIHGFVREARLDKAFQLFEKMQKQGFVPGVSLYGVMIEGLCKNKKLDEAFCLYSQMNESGIRPDVGIVSNLASCFSENEELFRFLENNWDGINMDAKANALLYNSVLNALVKNDSVDKAYHLLHSVMGDENSGDIEMDKLCKKIKGVVQPNTASFSIVIDGLLQAAKLDMALTLFQEMRRINCKPNVTLYNNIIQGLCNSNRVEESYDLLKEMRESGFNPTHFTYNSIYGCLCKREDIARALDLVKEMHIHGHEPWIKHSTLLIKRLCENGRVLEACEFLSDMVQEGFFIDIITFSAAMDGLIKIEQLDKALKLFNDIRARGYCPDVVAHNIIINGLCKAQRVSEAQSTMSDMVANGFVPSVVTYNLLIDGWCKIGNFDQAMLCLSKMSGEKREPTVITYTTLIHGFCSAERPEDALMMWNEMEEKACVPNRIAFMALIRGLCKCGKVDEALTYLREMENKEMRPDDCAYIELISIFLSNENALSAFEILNRMIPELVQVFKILSEREEFRLFDPGVELQRYALKCGRAQSRSFYRNDSQANWRETLEEKQIRRLILEDIKSKCEVVNIVTTEGGCLLRETGTRKPRSCKGKDPGTDFVVSRS
ncbi:hypothetical protein ACFE04_024039 [Oxalis oulophora]